MLPTFYTLHPNPRTPIPNYQITRSPNYQIVVPHPTHHAYTITAATPAAKIPTTHGVARSHNSPGLRRIASTNTSTTVFIPSLSDARAQPLHSKTLPL
jgi:hypothetical protein